MPSQYYWSTGQPPLPISQAQPSSENKASLHTLLASYSAWPLQERRGDDGPVRVTPYQCMVEEIRKMRGGSRPVRKMRCMADDGPLPDEMKFSD